MALSRQIYTLVSVPERSIQIEPEEYPCVESSELPGVVVAVVLFLPPTPP